METNIQIISHNEHRYPTLGDYWVEDGRLQIRVSDVGNVVFQNAIAIHEYWEATLCLTRGIKFEDIDAFDIAYEERGEGEPGDEKEAPYYKEHQAATLIEMMYIQSQGHDWNDYVRFLNNFVKNHEI